MLLNISTKSPMLSHPYVFVHTDFSSQSFSNYIFRAAPMAYGRSQARGWIGAIAAGLCHSHSLTRSEQRLQPQQHWILNALNGARDHTRVLMDTSQVCYCCATMGTPPNYIFLFSSPIETDVSKTSSKGNSLSIPKSCLPLVNAHQLLLRVNKTTSSYKTLNKVLWDECWMFYVV